MKEKYDLCYGRDMRGRQWYARVPAGLARTGMFVRLMGGVFLLVEKVESGGSPGGNVPVCMAVELLEGIWRGKGYG